MKKILYILGLIVLASCAIPKKCCAQINNFPWIHNFDNLVGLQQDQNDFGDWILKQGPTSSFNTGPTGDHTTGSSIYYYVESSNPNFPNKVFTVYTPTFDISATPGKVLSFWYHMYGATMGDLEIAVITSNTYTPIDTISGDQGNQWLFAYYPITAIDSFKIAFKATTGAGYTSDICIDDIMVSDPYTFIYGCMDSVSSNYNPLATISNGTCIYIPGCTDASAVNYNPWANQDNNSCIQNVACNPNQSLVDVAIKLDNWPNETSWLIYSATDTFASVPINTYNYTQTGQTIHTQVCIPVGDSIMFTINDSYGDGIGGGSVVGGCLVTNLDCQDTVFYLNPPNFGYTASSNSYVSGACNNNIIIYGCTNSSYLEYDSTATDDDGSCMTLATYGCTDTAAFNYDPAADKMLLTSPCTYNLILYDDGGDSWGACWLGVKQGDSLWQFKITNNGIYSDTFALTLNSNDKVNFYYFEIPTPQQNAQQLDIQTIQNSFKLENSYGTIIHEGNNPWPGPNENKLRNYNSDLDIYKAQPYCGNECIPVVVGCLDSIAYNYNSLANTNDTCYYSPGCTNPGYLEYYTQGFIADISDGSCNILALFGCTDPTAFNYDNTANVDNGGCIPVVLGCMQPLAFNYNPNANTPDTCIAIVYGCTSDIAINYNPLANVDDGSCIGVVYGCTDTTAFNWNPNANVDDDSCIPVIYGCINPTMFNYCDTCNTNDGSCIEILYGCTDSTMFNYNSLANVDNNSCIPFIYGCTDPSMLNYNASANTEDFSCIPYIYGCMDSTAFNYNPTANTDNGSCVAVVQGCMDVNAWNYNPLANINHGHDSLGCLYAATWCINGSGNPFFLNDECYAWVIDVDDYCCENEWDTICQATYDYCQGTWSGPLLKRGEKNLIMITDLLGRPVTKIINNTPLLFIYDNGSVIRKIKINK
tara:strand:+ start:17972 stop:20758 length:2787 start_codon:yes stop_codon:yes gene_type:complete